MSVSVRPLEDGDRPWAVELLRERWGSEVVVTNGKARDASALEGFVAELEGEPVGLATYETRGAECELITLDSFQEGIGAGSALLAAVANAAWRQRCRKLSVVTTNDNVRALGFYQRRGFTIAALRKGAVEKSRRIKPEIPELGRYDIPIRDEIELALDLGKHLAQAAASDWLRLGQAAAATGSSSAISSRKRSDSSRLCWAPCSSSRPAWEKMVRVSASQLASPARQRPASSLRRVS
jgi:ribosomal protein S18 acetylase RimI-like enzyme